jgi:sulfatase maturation enzyme AslB (radical SAM superfamily)
LKNCRSDYLIVGGILDNICNSACQFCNSLLSTKIGSLESGKNYQLTDNSSVFLSLPQERIVELDINGGEPSNSPNYSRLLDDLPVNCRIVRINTNASKFINQLPEILQRGIKVIVTISLDGTADVYEYARWPLKWSVFDQVVSEYMRLHQSYKNLSLNFWTTVSAYTINDMDNISDYARHKQIDLDWGLLDQPSCLNIRYSNFITTRAATKIPELQSLLASETDNNTELKSYIEHQDRMRGTDYRNIYG